ncbi:hypothetical protein LTR67_008309 [Exophiala xenobiotica]
MEPNYFTCTLGQAVQYQDGERYDTVTDLIDCKAQTEPSTPVVGFFSPGEKGASWKSHILTFRDVRQGSEIVAEALSTRLGSRPGQTVALLCPSSPDFLFTWLTIIRLGHSALLIAPQCSPSAVAHLCRSCDVRFLLYDEICENLAEKASEEASKGSGTPLETLLLPFSGEDIFDVINRPLPKATTRTVAVKQIDIAYLHHTSGTSTGIPKPIPQSHRAAVGVLPALDGRRHASFTTTPLYHGGIADLFRAWTSNALIWLFPGQHLPITAANVCKCLEVASSCASKGSPEVKYFSSVPYILQMMADDKAGLKHLQRMDIVGVGGAALPEEVGDRLVRDKVNLISRFGSAECGFLMSSYRDFEKDKAWQYLRSSPGGEQQQQQQLLVFERQEDGLSELVIQPGWPHMAKHNRDDGSYATADLFAPHPSLANAWRYHSRADSQLTLITGKKFDPAPLEDAIRACSLLIDDALIFGNGQSYPGVLLFRSSQGASTSDKQLCAEFSPIIENFNRESQSHARIPRNMLIPMPHAEHNLEKSSKGTVLRGKAEERYAENIAKAYENVLPNGDPQLVSDEQVPIAIRNIILNIVGERTDQDQGTLSDDTDFFAYGIDSVGCIQIRHALSHLIPKGSPLPLTVVEDQGTISGLNNLILRMRSGQMINGIEHEQEQADQQQMLDLAKEYSTFNNNLPPSATSASTTNGLITPESPSPASKSPQAGLRILLTGPTGSLGSHILHQLLSNPRVSHIHLLVRGASAHASRERVLKALSSRLLPISADLDFDAKTTIWQCKLSDARLGLSDTEYTDLRSNIDVIIHLAWSVNFLLPLRSFAATHLSGLRNLIDLALSSPQPTPPRVVFCSSVASVSQYPDLDLDLNQGSASAVPERPMSSPASAGPTGYARSKWVAEAICVAAHRHTRLRNRISIARVGQLSGATDTGVWSKSEAYPLMLSSMKATGVLPALQGEVLNWLPVDLAARAFVEDALNAARPGARRDVGRDASTDTDPNLTHVDEQDEDEISVHHVLNPNNDVQWSDLLSCLSRSQRETFKTVPVHEWLDALSLLQHDEKTKDHPSLKLLGFWKTAYSSKSRSRSRSRSQVHSQPSPEADGEATTRTENSVDAQVEARAAKAPIQYGMNHTYDRMPCLKTQASQVMKEEYMLQLWDWIKEHV